MVREREDKERDRVSSLGYVYMSKQRYEEIRRMNVGRADPRNIDHLCSAVMMVTLCHVRNLLLQGQDWRAEGVDWGAAERPCCFRKPAAQHSRVLPLLFHPLHLFLKHSLQGKRSKDIPQPWWLNRANRKDGRTVKRPGWLLGVAHSCEWSFVEV